MELFVYALKLWRESPSTIKATWRTIALKEGAQSIHQEPSGTAQRSRQLLWEHKSKQRKAGVAKSAQPERVSLIALVPEKNETHRFCADYRRLNAATMQEIVRYHVWMIL